MSAGKKDHKKGVSGHFVQTETRAKNKTFFRNVFFGGQQLVNKKNHHYWVLQIGLKCFCVDYRGHRIIFASYKKKPRHFFTKNPKKS